MNKDILSEEITTMLSPFANEMEDERLGVFLTLSIGRILLKNPDHREIQEEELAHITDWIKSSIINNAPWISNLDEKGRPKKLMKFSSIEQMVKEADKVMLIEAQKLQQIQLKYGDEKLISELDDNYYIVQLLTAEALDNESAYMQHCIGQGSYDEDLNDPNVVFLSLRDSNNKPHATIELIRDDINQLQGKQNKIPNEKYLSILRPFLIKNNYSINSVARTLGYLSDENHEWHNIHNLPANLTINTRLNLANANIKKLPANLFVKGDLIISDNPIKKIPANLKVKGNLLAASTKINKISDGLEVDGILQLIYIRETLELPRGIKIGEGLNLNSSNIKSLPSDLNVNVLNIKDTLITELVEGIKINDTLHIDLKQLEYLPNSIEERTTVCENNKWKCARDFKKRESSIIDFYSLRN